ncbi:metallophosphoesterase [Draconibacterium sp.]|nr:metallophosphoesterase [Draconibacterium sp.]
MGKNQIGFIRITWLTTSFVLLFAFLVFGKDSRVKPFTIIIFPDTQMYAKDDPAWRKSSRKEVFMAMTKWVVKRAKSDNIKFVLHMGDIVNEDYEPYEWQNANEAMSLLDDVVPYTMVVGNHDMAPGDPAYIPDSMRNTTNFNNTFPYSRYQNKPWYGGRMIEDHFIPGDSYDNSFHFFEQGKLEFMIVNLEVGPTDEVLTWADSLIADHPTKRIVVITHSYMLSNDKRDFPGGFGYLPAGSPNTGEEIWDKLIKKHKNIFLVLSGHVANADSHRGLLESRGVNGNIVYQQLHGDAHDGWLRILRFVPAENKIFVSSYSPWKPKSPDEQLKQYEFSLPGYNRDSIHQYELPYNMNIGENR